MKWTKDKLALFFSMKEEGCSIEEICNALGCERQAVYDKTKSLIKMNGGRMPKYNVKSNDKGDKDMSKYPPKRVKVDAAEVWRMLDEGKTRREIAEHFGVSVQTICNRITAGRPKAEKHIAEDAKFEAIIESVDAGSVTEKEAVPETSAEISAGDDVQGGKGVEANTVGAIHESPETNNVDNTVGAIHESPETNNIDNTVGAIHESPETNNVDNVEGDTDMNTKEAIMNTFLGSGRPSGDECADEEIGNGDISGLYKNTKGARPHEAYMAASEKKSAVDTEAEKPDIIDLAFKAKHMAFYAGFTPNYMMLDMQKERSEIIVSGEGEDGKVYEIEFSVSDPMYFSR